MRRWMKVGLLFLFALTVDTQAAPIPATSSSSLIGADLGMFISQYGFSIHAGNTAWIQTAPPSDIPSLTTLYRSPRMSQGVQASLTVRVDELKELADLRSYVKKWMKDYSRLGFDVLASKPVTVNGQEGFLIDVLNREADKQLRQVVFMKSKTAVILTCRDHRESFTDTLKSCTEIMRHFQWRR